ncbi:MAG: FtsX-like permease family protein [Promethearchaeota archaeon]
MWFVWKRGFKTLTKNKSRSIPIILVLAFTIGISAAQINMQDTRSRMVDLALDKTDFPSGFVVFDPTPQGIVEAILGNFSDEYLESYELRLVMLVDFKFGDDIVEGLVVGLNSSWDDRFNKLIDTEGNENKGYNGTFEYQYYKFNELEKGTSFQVIYGSEHENFTIGEVGFSPEWGFYSLVEGVVFPSVLPFPVLYLDIKYVQDNFAGMPVINQVIYKLKGNVTQEEFEDELVNQVGPYIDKVISQDEYPFVKMHREDEENDREMINMVIGFLMFSSIIALVVLIHRLVDDDIKNVSIFQALGAKKGEVLSSYAVFIGLLLLFSLPPAFLIQRLFDDIITGLMANFMHFPFKPDLGLGYQNTIEISVVFSVVSFLTGLTVVARTFKFDVRKAMFHEVAFLEKTTFAERVARRLKKNLHPFAKYNIRRVFGRKIFLVFTILMLAMSMGLFVLIFSMNDSYRYSVNRKLYEVETWDITAKTWTYEDSQTVKSIISGVDGMSEVYTGIVDNAYLSKDNESFDEVFVFAYEEGQDLHEIMLEKGKLPSNSGECLISLDMTGQDHKLKVGDKVYLKPPTSNKTTEFTVVGVMNDFNKESLVVKMEDAGKLMEKEGKCNTAYIRVEDGASVDVVSRDIEALSWIKQTQSWSSFKEMLDYFVNSFKTILDAYTITLCAIAVVILSVVVKSTVDYRMNDFANMKALGISDGTLYKVLSYELLFYFSAAIGFGYLVGLMFGKTVIDMYSIFMPGIVFYAGSLVYWKTALYSILVLFAGAIIPARKIGKMNLADWVRGKAFG